ncbi:MAG: pilin [Candidatus Nanoarchaeia archaeon]|nr:pilin [Candidatus Nanoarchaeia archaeon]
MKQIWILLLLMLMLSNIVLAVDFDDDISDEDKETFDQILEPVMKIYNFIKYSATILAVVFLVFAGLSFIASGGDQGKREQAKMMGTYVVIGLIIIWVAPLIVSFLVG